MVRSCSTQTDADHFSSVNQTVPGDMQDLQRECAGLREELLCVQREQAALRSDVEQELLVVRGQVAQANALMNGVLAEVQALRKQCAETREEQRRVMAEVRFLRAQLGWKRSPATRR
eukprot:EG_transcript_31558